MITPVYGLFEAHLEVASLDASMAFFRDRLGLELAHVTPGRQAAFFWAGARGRTMLGLWQAGAAPQRTTTHIAFAASIDDVLAAPARLRSSGIVPLDFDGKPADEPVVLAWMPAVSIYFRDPDGHLLEYIAMLPDEPRPGEGVRSWREWISRRPRSRRFAPLSTRDAILISSPEYAHGVSGVLKNALDWVVGSGELIDKPVDALARSARTAGAR